MPHLVGAQHPADEQAAASPLLRQPLIRMAAVIGTLLLAALVVTWPLAAQLTTAVPLGTEHEATVQLFSIWTLWWTADRLAHGFADYWDAPFFYPNPGVFTYSEPQPLTGLAVAPLWGLGAPPALIHNLAFLGLLTLNGLFAYRLARTLGGGRGPALGGGLLMIALPGVSKVWGVLNLVPLFGLLWTLDGLVRWGRSGAARHALWAGVGVLVAFLTCQQYTLMFIPFLVVAGLIAWRQQGWDRVAGLRLGAVGLVVAGLVALLAWPAWSLHNELGFRRSDTLVQALSARPGDFLTRPSTALLPLPPPSLEDTAGLFPGLIVLILAGIGAVMSGRARDRRAWTIYLAGCALAAGVLALGLNVQIAGIGPYSLLRTVLPGLGELRTPFRYAVLGQMLLPVLAALGLGIVGERAGRKGAGLVLALALALLGTGENLTVPTPLVAVPVTPHTAWTAWLAAQLPGTVVAHIPFPAGLHISDYEIEARRMFAQIDHHQPIINGYSSYFPPGYTPFQLDMAQNFPDPALLCLMAAGQGVNTLVVDQDWRAAHPAALEAQVAFLQPLYQDAAVQIYRLQPPDGACQAP